MPIGIGIGGAVLGAGATIGSGIIGAHAQESAAQQANQSQQMATQAQLQLGQESLDLNKQIYGSNYDLLSPYVSRGNVAGDAINALLGLGAAPKLTNPLAPQPAGAGGTGAGGAPAGMAEWAQGAINAMAPNITRASTWQVANGISDPYQKLQYLLSQSPASSDQYPLYQAYLAQHPQPTAQTPPAQGGTPAPAGTSRPALDAINASRAERGLPPIGGGAGTPAAGGAAAGGSAAAQQTKAFQNFANSAGMQFQQQQAANSINNLYAGHGALQSGAAMKAISDRAEDIALNNYFMPYMGLLGGQQAVGAQSGAAVAGVGSNFGNTAANIYNGMGSSIQGGADSAANLALMRGNNSANMWGTIGNSLNGLASSFANPSSGFGRWSSPSSVLDF